MPRLAPPAARPSKPTGLTRGIALKYLIFAIALLFSAQTQAREQGDTYLGAQAGLSSFDIDDVDDIEIPFAVLRFGIHATRWLALEGRYGNDVEEGSVSGVDYAIDRIAGVYLIYHYNLSNDTSLRGLLGYSEIDLKAKSGGTADREDLTSTSLGLGFGFGGLNAELMRYIERSGERGTALSLGYSYYFD